MCLQCTKNSHEKVKLNSAIQLELMCDKLQGLIEVTQRFDAPLMRVFYNDGYPLNNEIELSLVDWWTTENGELHVHFAKGDSE